MKLCMIGKPIIFVENNSKDYSKQLIDLLVSMNYTLYWHIIPNNDGNPFYKPDDVYSIYFFSSNMICYHKSLPIGFT